jgi:hypothetical protein
MDPPVMAALVAAFASLVGTMANAVFTRRAQEEARNASEQLQRYQKDLKNLESRLAERRAEKDARRDYEYEALKRMYHECSPLLFQLAEQAGQVYSRIEGLALTASHGDLDGESSWLNPKSDRYYLRSTEYRLLATMATVKLLQERLTHLDLSLDVQLRVAYAIARYILRSMADDFDIARKGAKPLEYDPHNEKGDPLGRPEVYWQQGIPRGIMENAVESLIVRGPDGEAHVMTFLQFEAALADAKSPLHDAVKRIRYLFAHFHPGRRPVLWRVLLVYASLARAIRLWFERDPSDTTLPDLSTFLHIPASERGPFDWRNSAGKTAETESIEAAFAAADQYLTHTVERELNDLIRLLRPIESRA